jgi:mono/diheme cytochrome c family protein
MRSFLLGIVVALCVLIVGGWFVLKQGYVNFSADREPSAFEEKLAMDAVDASTDRRASDQKNPVAPTEDNLVAGTKLYINHCAGCHGVPSNPDSQFSQSFNPEAPGFFKDAPDMSDNQNFYIIQHGIRWSGMPAWNKTLSDQQIWQVVAFLGNIEKLPARAQAEFGATSAQPAPMPHNMPMNH